jgi:hypothetical protein
MRTGILLVLCGLTLPAVAEAAPSQLYGKSVVVSISETRASRPVTGGPVTSSSSSAQFSVYVSEAGRSFVRSDRTLTTGRRGTEQKAIDSAPGSKIGVSVSSGVQFSGNTMILTMRMISGARRITVTFDGGFTSCSATVLNAREGGKPMVIKNRFTGVEREVTDIQASVTGCSVKTGNVFAGG